MLARVIVNPVSGRRSEHRRLARLQRVLADQGCDLSMVRTEGPGDAGRLAAETPDETRVLLVAGGDGTVREVVEGLGGRRIPLMVLPFGTENVLAKSFRYHSRIDQIVSTVFRGRTVDYDIGVCSERKFLLHVGVGFDADLVHRVHAARQGHGAYVQWILPGVQTLWQHRYPGIRVQVDGRTVFEGRGMVWTGILPRYALGVPLLSRARFDDGLLDVCILPCQTRGRLLAHGVRLLLHRHLRATGAQYHQARHVQVLALNGQPVRVQADGDESGILPIECSIIPGGLRLLVPPTYAR